MSRSFRRYEILLPLKFNDGQPVPDELVGATLAALRQKFGAVSSETQTIHGTWSNVGEVYEDDLIRVFVDVEQEQDATEFFVAFKEELKQRFQQFEIWIVTYPVDVL